MIFIEEAMLLAIGFMFFGFIIGFISGMHYIPHQIKKKNGKTIDRISKLINDAKNN